MNINIQQINNAVSTINSWLDVDVTFSENQNPSDLLVVLQNIVGIDKVVPSPDAEPF